MLESSTDSFGPPLDLVHLARQCLGDHELETELLGLFRLQARALTAQLSGSPSLSLESKAKIAHTLRGSALAVGARRVASAAWRIEELAAAAGDQGSAARAIAALLSAVAEALTEIDRIRG
jgi:chemotaxis protein histidine kinase CheA